MTRPFTSAAIKSHCKEHSWSISRYNLTYLSGRWTGRSDICHHIAVIMVDIQPLGRIGFSCHHITVGYTDLPSPSARVDGGTRWNPGRGNLRPSGPRHHHNSTMTCRLIPVISPELIGLPGSAAPTHGAALYRRRLTQTFSLGRHHDPAWPRPAPDKWLVTGNGSLRNATLKLTKVTVCIKASKVVLKVRRRCQTIRILTLRDKWDK